MLKIKWAGMLTLERFQVWHERMRIRFSILNPQTGSLPFSCLQKGNIKKFEFFKIILANSLRPCNQALQQSQLYQLTAAEERDYIPEDP